MSEYLRDVCMLKGGTGFPESLQGRQEGDLPFIKVSDMSSVGNEKFITAANNYVAHDVAAKIRASVFPPRATVFAKVGAALLLNRRRILTAPTVIDNNMMAAIPTTADPDFLYHFLSSVDFGDYVQTGVLPSVNQSTLGAIPFPVFQPGEQQRIAKILSAIDDAIEQTNALIAKTQQIKAGLMHDLFTRGVTPDGQLRPPREEAPQLYKESPLGWIPGEWDAQPCSEVTELITVGIVVRPAQYYVTEGIPAFRSANIREDGIDPTDLVYISPQSNSLLAKSQVRTGDVLSVRTGYPGTSAVVLSEYAGANCVDILISRPCAHLRSAYLAAWINSSFGKEQVLQKQGGLAQQHFNVGELRDLLVALPSAPEQDGIIARFRSIDDKVATERALAQKYATLKAGLMHDLLTGRVRVPVAKIMEATQ